MYRIINGNNKPTAESEEETFFNYLTPSFLKKPLTLPKRPLFFQIIDESTKKCVAGYVLNQKMLTLKACDIFDHSQLWSLYEGQLIPRSYGQIGDCLNENLSNRHGYGAMIVWNLDSTCWRTFYFLSTAMSANNRLQVG